MAWTFITDIKTQTRTEMLERIADKLLSLNNIERFDYAILLRHKMGLNRFGPEAFGSSTTGGPAKENVKLEKFDASTKLKVIEEIGAFTDLGLKEAKDLVEKAPVVFKKGMLKDEGEKIVEKLKEVGATVVLE